MLERIKFYFLAVLFVVGILQLIKLLNQLSPYFLPLFLAVAGITICYATIHSIKVRQGRAKQGYWISSSNQEVHTVHYHEGEHTLEFDAENYPNEYILMFPDELKWQHEMSGWAKDRREIILERLIKELEQRKSSSHRKFTLKIVSSST